MISSVNAGSLLIRRYYFGTFTRSSLRRKKGMERVNVSVYLCEFESRLDTRGLAVLLKLYIGFRFEKKRKKDTTKK